MARMVLEPDDGYTIDLYGHLSGTVDRETGMGGFGVGLALIAWFYFATVDHVQVWGFGPFSSREECLVHREMTIPITVEATSCGLMVVEQEE